MRLCVDVKEYWNRGVYKIVQAVELAKVLQASSQHPLYTDFSLHHQAIQNVHYIWLKRTRLAHHCMRFSMSLKYNSIAVSPGNSVRSSDLDIRIAVL